MARNYAVLMAKLRAKQFGLETWPLQDECAAAIEALVADRDVWKETAIIGKEAIDKLMAERDALKAELAEWKAKYLATKALPVGGQLLKAMPVGWHSDTTNPRGDDSDPEPAPRLAGCVTDQQPDCIYCMTGEPHLQHIILR